MRSETYKNECSEVSSKRPVTGVTEDVTPQQLRVQRQAWDDRPLVRALYTGWFNRIVDELARVEGPTVELGCGIGTFKEFRPDTIATDVVATPWTDEVVDAERLPYGDTSVANFVLVDVLHHLPRPGRFFDEAARTLTPGGRVVLVEPYCSPLSTPLYKRLHSERTDLSADPFGDEDQSGSDPFDSNQALPTLTFWRNPRRFAERHPEFHISRRDRFALLAYPLSGGFTGRRLAPYRLLGPLMLAERLLRPLASFAAFRCLVVLERRAA
jgi:SAM-dependent methyltransferase